MKLKHSGLGEQMKHPSCRDFAIASGEGRRSERLDDIGRIDEVASREPRHFHRDADSAPSLAGRGHQHLPLILKLKFLDRRRRERARLGDVTACQPPETDSGGLYPRPYLMTSRTAWITLDFVIAICCGILVLLVSGAHLNSLGRWSVMTPLGPLKSVFSIVKVGLFAACVAGFSGIFGLPPFAYRKATSSELLLIVSSVTLAADAVGGALVSLVSLSRTNDLFEIILTSGALMLCRTLWRRHWDVNIERDIAGRNILIVGVNQVGRDVRDHLSSLRYMGFRFKGFVTLDQNTESANLNNDSAIVGKVEDVISLARSLFVDEIIFSGRPATPNILSNVLIQAEAAGIDVRLIPSLSETLKRHADVSYLGDLPTIVLHCRKNREVSNLLKRAIDIALGGAGIIAVFPLFLVIAILIKLDSTGPIFYGSKRVGYKGTTFNCYKFRSMIEDADSGRAQLAHLNERHGILFKIEKDPRITRVGAFLRKYSLDELPQLWNVFSGDMSLVGPRPSIRSEVAQYKTEHLQRLDVIPGMTGLWQVEARKDPSFERYVNLDSKYVRNWSIWLDFTILARTIGVVLRGTGS